MKARLLEARPAYKNSFDHSKGYKTVEAGTEVEITGYNDKADRFIGKTADGWTLNFNTDEAEPIDD